MRILITGSHGVLGTALKRELRNRSHQVFGCDLKHSDDPQEIRADVSDYTELTGAFLFSSKGVEYPEIVFHLAGEFGRKNGDKYPRSLWSTNCLGTRNVIQLCLNFGSRLVFASSSEAYGNLADYHNLDESLLVSHVPHFHNEYALTKWVGEKQIEIARERDGLKAVSLRFFNVYGEEPYSEYRSVVCRFIYRLLHRQPITVHKGSRDFLYITDWAHTVANVADRFDDLREPAYNIGGAASTFIPDLATIIAIQCGFPLCEVPGKLIAFADAEPGNVAVKVPEIKLAQRDLGHDPQVSLDRGIALTVAWMRQRYNIPAPASALSISSSV